MKEEILYSSFLEEIVQKIPQKSEVVNTLASMLNIGKEAVYRRLRKEVPFTFYEVMTISRQLNISLDDLRMNSMSTAKPLHLSLIEYIDPAEPDFAFMRERVSIIKAFSEGQNPETGEIANILPLRLYISYKNVVKFYLFKWKYQSNRSHKAIPYKDIVISDKLYKIQEEYVKYAEHIQTEYILISRFLAIWLPTSSISTM